MYFVLIIAHLLVVSVAGMLTFSGTAFAQIRTNPFEDVGGCVDYAVLTLTEHGLQCMCIFGEDSYGICKDTPTRDSHYSSIDFPSCGEGQVLMYNSEGLVECTALELLPSLPSCSEGEVLRYNNGGIAECTRLESTSALPSCEEGETLKYNSEGTVICTKVTSAGGLPTCSVGQELTYNGEGVAVCTTPSVTITSCLEGQYLFGIIKGIPQCRSMPAQHAPPSCAAGEALTYRDNAYICEKSVVTIDVPTCEADEFLTGVNGRFVCRQLIHESCDSPVRGNIRNGEAALNDPYSVVVHNGYAYIASYSSNALEIIDITNPRKPTHAGKLEHNQQGAKLFGARSVYIHDNYAYVTSYISNALEIIDISNPARPRHVGAITRADSRSFLFGSGVVVRGGLCLLRCWSSC